jgi:hypothetical protein
MTGADSFFSSGTLLREKYGSLLGNERVAESEEIRVILKPTLSLHIYMDAHITECSYILTGPYRIQILS